MTCCSERYIPKKKSFSVKRQVPFRCSFYDLLFAGSVKAACENVHKSVSRQQRHPVTFMRPYIV